MNFLLIALPALAGGMVQGMAGFGCSIVMMLFFPMLLSVQHASTICQASSILLSVSMVYTYRKYVNLKLCLKPWLFYFPIYYTTLSFAAGLNAGFLKPLLGLFLVFMSIYCTYFSDKIHIKANALSALACAGIGGITGGFFGIDGPPIVLYFLATTEKKEEYLGSIQMFFLVSSAIGTCMRISKGLIPAENFPYLIIVIVMLLVGKSIGSRFVEKLDQALMKKLVYGFVGVSGFITFLTNLSALGL